METKRTLFAGPVEADESYFGGKRKNMSNARRNDLREQGFGRGPTGKTAIVGIKDRKTNQIQGKVIRATDKTTLQGYVLNTTIEDAQVYADDALAYRGLPRKHSFVRHSTSQYVNGMNM